MCVFVWVYNYIFKFSLKVDVWIGVYWTIVVSILPVINKLKAQSESVTCFARVYGPGLCFITFWFGALPTEVPNQTTNCTFASE